MLIAVILLSIGIKFSPTSSAPCSAPNSAPRFRQP